MSQGHTYYKALALEKWLHLTNAKFEIWEVLMNIIGRVLITAVTTNTCPLEKAFFFGSNLRFGGRQSTVTIVFTSWPRENSLPVS